LVLKNNVHAKYLGKKIRKVSRFIYSLPFRLQCDLSTVCGEYCLFFTYHLSRNFSLTEICNYFTIDCKNNDKLVKDFIWRVFPGHEHDLKNIFWMKQTHL
jgi:hypothetical protein